MKASFTELQHDFWLTLEAETMEEAAILTRLALNGRQVTHRATNVGEKGAFTTEMSFQKTDRNATNQIQPRVWGRKR